jgi:hypothetical protein
MSFRVLNAWKIRSVILSERSESKDPRLFFGSRLSNSDTP